MSDFLGRVGRITEWVVISNLENRIVNAACDKVQDWWKNRKHKNQDQSQCVTANTSVPVTDPNIQMPYQFSIQPQQSSYQTAQSYPFYMTFSTPPGHLTINTNQIDGLDQWGPLAIIIECNHQRYQTKLHQPSQPFVFSIYQFEYDLLSIWIRADFQQRIIAHTEIPVRILLSDNHSLTSSYQRWIPLRDDHNNPTGQILITIYYQIAYSTTPPNHRSVPPPPYSSCG